MCLRRLFLCAASELLLWNPADNRKECKALSVECTKRSGNLYDALQREMPAQYIPVGQCARLQYTADDIADMLLHIQRGRIDVPE